MAHQCEGKHPGALLCSRQGLSINDFALGKAGGSPNDSPALPNGVVQHSTVDMTVILAKAGIRQTAFTRGTAIASPMATPISLVIDTTVALPQTTQHNTAWHSTARPTCVGQYSNNHVHAAGELIHLVCVVALGACNGGLWGLDAVQLAICSMLQCLLNQAMFSRAAIYADNPE